MLRLQKPHDVLLSLANYPRLSYPCTLQSGFTPRAANIDKRTTVTGGETEAREEEAAFISEPLTLGSRLHPLALPSIAGLAERSTHVPGERGSAPPASPSTSSAAHGHRRARSALSAEPRAGVEALGEHTRPPELSAQPPGASLLPANHDAEASRDGQRFHPASAGCAEDVAPAGQQLLGAAGAEGDFHLHAHARISFSFLITVQGLNSSQLCSCSGGVNPARVPHVYSSALRAVLCLIS